LDEAILTKLAAETTPTVDLLGVVVECVEHRENFPATTTTPFPIS
jgi:hypothetical protein